MIYFTSDQHFSDAAMLDETFIARPFASVREMDETIITRFLERTRDADEIYMLGDIFGVVQPDAPLDELTSLMARLGAADRPFYLMRGNHDHLSDDGYLRAGFRKVFRNFATIEAGGHELFICHDPCMVQPRGSLALCGHVHTLFEEVWNPVRESLTINISVEVRGYAPVSLDELMDIASTYRYI